MEGFEVGMRLPAPGEGGEGSCGSHDFDQGDGSVRIEGGKI